MFAAEKSSKLTSPTQHYHDNRIKIMWPDRSLRADARVTFEWDAQSVLFAMSMLQVSEDDDYEFTDLA